MFEPRRSLALISLLTVLVPATARAQRQMEKLGRGVMVIRTSSTQTYIGWRLLGNDPEDIAFNLYRSANGGTAVKVNATPITATTDYTDTPANLSSTAYTYSVRPVINGVEVTDTWANTTSGPVTLPVNAPQRLYVPVPIQPTPDDAAAGVSYDVKFCWVGDFDGDGEYDFLIDRTNPNVEAKQWLQAYKRDGTLLWQMDMGPNSVDHYNITPGSSSVGIGHGDNVTVYDLDGDGMAEVVVRTANGVVFANGTTLTAPNNEVQYISIIDGLSGAEKARGTVPIPASWPTQTHVNGQMGIVYADGLRPSIFFHPSNRNADLSFNKCAITWDYRNGALTQRWVWLESGHTAEGHQLRLADVNNDGKDEYVDIGNVVKADGSGQINENVLTEVTHGDRFHVADIDPDRPGEETFLIQQNNPTGLATAYHTADKSTVIKKWYASDVVDVGRGTIGAFVPNVTGLQMFSTQPGVFDCKGNQLYSSQPFPPETVWWDGDLSREFLSTIGSSATSPGIDKFNTANASTTRLLSIYSDAQAPGYPFNNYIAYGGRPQFWGDILGDWREEVLCVASDNSELRIYTTKNADTAKTGGGMPFRIYTLMHNPQYRIQATTKGYVQSSYVDYYLGYGMTPPPPPPMVDAKLVWKGGAGSSTWDGGVTASWRNNGVDSTFSDGDSVRFDLSGNNATAVNLTGTLQPEALTVYNPLDYTFAGTGTLAGTMKLTKSGAGAMILPNNHTFTGKTTVWDGALVVNGNLQNSPVTIWGGTWGGAMAAGKTGGRLAGTGQVGQAVTIKYRGAITPGAGMNSAGTLTCAGGLSAENGATFALDLSDDPTGTVKANDRIAVTGDLTLSGTVKIVVNPLNTNLAPGTYTLATYTGTLTGGTANLSVVVPAGTPYTLAAGGGAISLTVPVTRAAAAVTWRGTGGAWDLAASQNWLRAGAADVFVAGDSVTFDATGAASPAVTLSTVLPIAGLTVNSNTDYTFSGTGALDGAGGLTKSGTGTLTINTENTYSGPTVISGGVLAVSSLDDAGSPSPIGASTGDASNLVINGGTLRLTGSQTNMNRNATLGASGGTFDIASSIQISGVLSGAGSLTKTGTGTLLLAGANTFTGGTVIDGGKIYLAGATANTSGLGSGTVTILNGTLAMADVQASETAAWNIVVPSGATGRLDADGRCSLTGSLTGGGDFTFYSPYVRTDMKGNWSAFTGRINAICPSGGADFRIANSFGFANAALNLGADIYAYYNLTMSGGVTLAIGELSGVTTAKLRGGPTSGRTLTWQVGGRNTDSTFSGNIGNSTGSTALTKVGTGTLTLAPTTVLSSSTVAASTTVTLSSTSTLRVNMAVTGAGIPAGTIISAIPSGTTITLSAAATLSGTADLKYAYIHTYTGATTVSAGKLVLDDAALSGTNVTVASAAGFGGNGSVVGNVNLNAGSTLLVNPADGPLAVTGNLTLGGAVTVSPVPGVTLGAGTYQLCTYTGSLTGTPAFSWSGADFVATFDTSVSGQVNMTLSLPPRMPGDVVWTGANSTNWDSATFNWSWTGGATGFLTNDLVHFDDSSTVNAVSIAETVAPASVTVNSTQNYTFSGAGTIDGAATLSKSGSGTLTISTAQTFSGGTTIHSGTVAIGNAAALGTGTVTLNGGTWAMGTLSPQNPIHVTADSSISGGDGGGAHAVKNISGANTLTLNATSVFDMEGDVSGFSGTFAFTGSGSFRLFTTTYDGSASATFDLGTKGLSARQGSAYKIGALLGQSGSALGMASNNNSSTCTYTIGGKNIDSTFAGVIANGSSTKKVAITKTGSGNLVLSGANTYTGNTTVSAGKLTVSGSLAATPTTIASGATLAGNGSIAGAVTCNGVLEPGATLGTLTCSAGLTLASTSVLNFDLGTTSDLTAVTGNLTLDGTLNVAAAAGFAAGTYTLITYTGTLTNNTLVLGSLPAGFTGSINTATANQVKLVVTSAQSSAQVTLSGLARTYDGQPKQVDVTTNPSGIATSVTYNGSATAPTQPGSYLVAATVTEPGYVGSATGTMVISPRSFSAWETANFTPAQILAGESAPNADPDHDGLTNLAEYALGGNPYGFTAQPVVTRDAGSISITFQRPANIGDVIYQAQAGGDFQSWENLTLEVLNPGADPESVRATKPLSPPVPASQFLRLKFTK